MTMTIPESNDWSPVSPRSLNINAYLAEQTVVFKPQVIQHVLSQCVTAQALEQAIALPAVRRGLRHMQFLSLPACPMHPSDLEILHINTEGLRALALTDDAALLRDMHRIGAFANIKQLTITSSAGCSDAGVMLAMSYEGLQYLELRCEVTREQLMRLLAPGRALNVRLLKYHSLLYKAVMLRDQDLLRILHAAGADINGCDDNKMTLLTAAVAQNQLDAIPALLAAGADLHVSDGYGFTPVAWAALRGNDSALQLLIGAGADIQRLDPHGRSPLELAIRANALAATRYLVVAGAEVRGLTARGSTPLIEAVLHGDMDLVRFLVGAGADPGATCKRGLTAFNYAALAGKHAIAAYLGMSGPSLARAV